MVELDVKKVRRIMAAKGYNVKSLAEAAGLSYPALNGWLTRGIKPRTDTLGKLAKTLEVDIYDILKE